MNMGDILKRNGWKNYSSCACGGSYNELFRNPNLPRKEVRIFPKLGKWNLYVSNNLTAYGTDCDFIEKMIENKLIENDTEKTVR